METTAHEPSALHAAPPIIVGSHDVERLRELVERHAGGAEAGETLRLALALARAVVVPQADLPPEIVAVGSRVSFEDEATARCMEVELAWPGEADPARGRLSVLSPVGVALLGAAAWQTVEYAAAQGERGRVRVVSVAPGNRCAD